MALRCKERGFRFLTPHPSLRDTFPSRGRLAAAKPLPDNRIVLHLPFASFPLGKEVGCGVKPRILYKTKKARLRRTFFFLNTPSGVYHSARTARNITRRRRISLARISGQISLPPRGGFGAAPRAIKNPIARLCPAIGSDPRDFFCLQDARNAL